MDTLRSAAQRGLGRPRTRPARYNPRRVIDVLRIVHRNNEGRPNEEVVIAGGLPAQERFRSANPTGEGGVAPATQEFIDFTLPPQISLGKSERERAGTTPSGEVAAGGLATETHRLTGPADVREGDIVLTRFNGARYKIIGIESGGTMGRLKFRCRNRRI